MIELQNTIELKTYSKEEQLSFSAKYLVEINFTFDLHVKSNGFTGTSSFCVRKDEIERFCDELLQLYSLLSGCSIINDEDSDSYVQFNVEPYGHIYVRGQVGGSHEDHYMKFCFQTDQTCLPYFIEGFNNLLSIYSSNF